MEDRNLLAAPVSFDDPGGITGGINIWAGNPVASIVYDADDTDTAKAIVHVDGDVYAIASRSGLAEGKITTVSISPDGATTSVLNSFAFETVTALEVDINHVGGDIFAVTYQGPDNDGWLKTVQISNDGLSINLAPVASNALEFDAIEGREAKITHVAGNIFAIAYRGPGTDAWLATVNIASNGNIVGVADSFEFDTTVGREADIVRVDSDTIAVAYNGPGSDGWMRTFDIDAGGNINEKDLFEFDSTDGYNPEITWVVGNVYAIAYSQLFSGGPGKVATLEIAVDGSITPVIIDTHIIASNVTTPKIAYTHDGFAIVYQDGTGGGSIHTIDITPSGTITAASGTNSVQFDVSSGKTPALTHVTGNIFAVLHSDNSGGNAGILDTINISTNQYVAIFNTTLNVGAASGVLANDVGAVNANLVDSVSHGSLTLNADGSFAYVPNPADPNARDDSFTYFADDGVGNNGNKVRVSIQIVPPGANAPLALDDAFSTTQETMISVPPAGVLANDLDPEGDPMTAVLDSGPSNGSLTLNSDGSFSYSPNLGFGGMDSFVYKANDGTNDGNLANATIAVDARPVVASDSYATSKNTQITVSAAVGVLLNDSDMENDPLAAVFVSGPANGALGLNADGSFLYTPNAGFTGNDTFAYKANDGSSDSATSATVTIVVNTAPITVGDSYSVDEDNVLTITAAGVLGNDSDVDAHSLTAVLISGPGNSASFILNGDGSFGYTPLANFSGVDTFTYKANDGTEDGNVATVTITVNPIDDAPNTVNDSYSVDEESTLTIVAAGVLGNDSDPDGDPLTVVLASGPSNSSSFSLNADGSFEYTPNTNFDGTDSFTYRANDGTIDGNTATVTITINPINDAPVLNPSPTLFFDTVHRNDPAPVGAVGTLIANWVDSDQPVGGGVDNVFDGDTGAVTGIALIDVDSTNGSWHFTTNGGASWNPVGAVTSSSALLLAAEPNTRLYFQPNANFFGTIDLAITFRAWDRSNGKSNGSALENVSSTGGTTAYSTGVDTVILHIPLPRVGVYSAEQGFWRIDLDGSQTWDGVVTDEQRQLGFPGSQEAVGDWNGDGHEDFGVFRASDGTWFIDANGNGKWDGPAGGDEVRYQEFGFPSAQPVVADWSGDGKADFGLFRASDGRFFLDANGNGRWDGPSGGDLVRQFATGIQGSQPAIGDWDGDGDKDLGVFRNTGEWYLDLNDNLTWDWPAGGDVIHDFSIGGTFNQPAVGDWNGDNVDDIGVFTAVNSTWYLDRSGNGSWDGLAGGDLQFVFAGAGKGQKPVVGDWVAKSALVAAAGPANGGTVESLSLIVLQSIVRQAMKIWSDAGLSPAAIETLNQVDISVANLPGAYLGLAGSTSITIDADAAGYGWFIDSTPEDDVEFELLDDDVRSARSATAVADQMDLLSVVLHELGHVLGLDHHDQDATMSEALAIGVRRLPSVVDIDALFAQYPDFDGL